MNNHQSHFSFMGFDYILFDGDGVLNADVDRLKSQGWTILGVDYYPGDRTKMTTIFRRVKSGE